ncbi:MAG: hypothetical protein ACM37V_11880 [Gemmatimonadota bacterium]
MTGRSPLSQETHAPVAGARPRGPGPLVVELVGPAGAGKTALLRALGREPRVRAGVRIERARLLPVFLLHSIRMIPLAFELLARGWKNARNGLLHCMRLRTLPLTIARLAAQGDCDAVLLDEGPIYSLGRLSVFQEAPHGGELMARTWRIELDRWATLLDAVIWIDAPDAVLAERIRARPKHHQIKGGTDMEMAGFLGRYRQAYREIQERLTASGRVKMVHLDTAGLPVEAAAERVMTELERLGLRRSD